MNIKIRLSILAAALAVILAPAHATTIDPSNYDYSMTISPAAGRIATTLSNFPLLVRLSSTRQPWFDPADCGTGGADLRFAFFFNDTATTEIYTWNPSGESFVWVNVPSLSPVTEIKVYWGVKNASLAPAVNAADTWPDYVAVYHLGEGEKYAYDSSANGYTATNAAAVSLGTNPPVGNCANIHDLYVTGVTDLLAAGAAKPLTDRSRVTFSAWVVIDSFNTGNNTYAQNARVEIARKFTGVNSDRHKGGFSCRYFANNAYPPKNSNPLFGLFMDDSTGISSDVHNWNTTAPASDGTWLYLTCTVDGTTAAKYINGTAMSDSPKSFSHGLLGPDSVLPLDFGAADNSSACQTHARMDEMRIRDGAVSAAWVAADYAQQTQNDFLVFDGESAGAFAVSPIPDQIVSAAEIQAGVTPSVAVTNLDENVGLVLDTDYEVAYSNNTASGTAYATVIGLGEYAAYTNVVAFRIVVLAEYYIVGGSNNEGQNTSSISGESGATGWSTTQGGARSMNGITAEDAIYYVWTNRWNRSPPNKNYATPLSTTIVIEPGCRWEIACKLMTKTVSLNNLVIRTNGKLVITPSSDGASHSNTYGGNYTLEEGASIFIPVTLLPNASYKTASRLLTCPTLVLALPTQLPPTKPLKAAIKTAV